MRFVGLSIGLVNGKRHDSFQKLIEAAGRRLRRLSAGSPFKASTTFKGDLAIKLVKAKPTKL